MLKLATLPVDTSLGCVLRWSGSVGEERRLRFQLPERARADALDDHKRCPESCHMVPAADAACRNSPRDCDMMHKQTPYGVYDEAQVCEMV